MAPSSYLCTWLLLGLAVSCHGSVSKISRRDVHGMLKAPHLPPTNTPLPPDMWFIQLLDHFDPTNTKTWNQRYQMLKDNYVKGGPVFLQIGGEGEASAVWMLKGAWVDYAKKYNALMFQVEHRYYGQSHPTRDLSTENLRYLSSEQALADLAYFISAMNQKLNLPAGTKWIAFGGSYSGNLAAWVRYKYPHLVHAAMSASGPVLAKIDFIEYMEVVRDSLATHSVECVEAVKTADNQVNALLRHPLGQQTINKSFRLCSPINSDNGKDVATLLESLAGNFAGVVQYNKENLATGWNVTIDTLCDIMVNESLGTPVVRYAAVNSLLMDMHKEECLGYRYENMINAMRNVAWDATNGARQWIYQTCTEFGFYQTAENNQTLFGKDFPLDFFVQQCADIYGKKFTTELLALGVDRSNTLYGGLDLTATRVVYVHGSIDPWHALGITSTRLPESPAIYIKGAAHCANMYPPADSDPPALKSAREEISSLIGKWLKES